MEPRVSRRPILLLLNPVAGGKPGSGPGLHGDAERLTPQALAAALGEKGLEVEAVELTEDADPGDLARRAADHGSDVVVAGGDGTVGAVAAALMAHPEATLGVLATGSFNNIARGFGIPATLDEALEVIAAGRTATVDAGWVERDEGEGRPFFEAGGVGLDAVGFVAAEVAGRRGWWRAIDVAWRGLRRRPTPMRITLDGTATEVRSPAVTVSNGPFHGLGFAISADADPTDGMLDVAVFDRMSGWEVLRHFAAVARRRPRREPRVVSLVGRRVTIEGLRRALPAHADGASVGMTPISFEVRPAALRIFR